MLSVAAALEQILALAAPVGRETTSLANAAGRVLAEPVLARRTQPPFDAAAMDGWAVKADDAVAGAVLRQVDEAAAGRRAAKPLDRGQAIRIFTGAPMPDGADAVLLQEDATQDADAVWVGETAKSGAWVRPAGGDFRQGEILLSPPRVLTPEDVALAASAGAPWVTAARRPSVSLLSLGDELRLPGEPLGADDIVASNSFGVAALAEAAGAVVAMTPPVADRLGALRDALRQATSADIIVTLGGASDGAHDLARPAVAAEGGEIGFYKIAMRPGKPLSAGRLGRSIVLGLPGNPVSAMVCARLFLVPLIARLLGLPGDAAAPVRATLGAALPANGPRAHYMRARFTEPRASGANPRLSPVDSQDSSLLTRLAHADALLIRPPHDPPRNAGERIDALPLRPEAAEVLSRQA